MQIDFHHAATYAIARLAGFSHMEADVVAWAAQYVDDATKSGLIRFDNGSIYLRTSSAHRMLDYRNFESLANHHVWVPFHFLPGNGGLPAGQAPPGPFIERMVCRPDSPPAQDMICTAIRDRDLPCALHRLGIALHVYADTWAHRGFAGISHEVNGASDLSTGDQPDTGLMDRLASYFVSTANPLGHGTVLSNPDKPWLVWSYTDGLGRHIARDNPRDYLQAADRMCQVIRRFRLGDAQVTVPGLPERDLSHMDRLFRDLHGEPEERHAAWLEEIRSGAFSFGPQEVSYLDKGEGSRKHIALGTTEEVDEDDEIFTYTDGFLQSDWKYFHDALQAHRLAVLHRVLPRYGICAG